MKRYSGVLLREGFGWVSLRDAIVASPPDVAAFGVHERAWGAGVFGFHVVDTPHPVALLTDSRFPLTHTPDQEKAVGLLRRGGLPTVLWLAHEAEGAAVGHCFGDASSAIDEAACAVFALKTIGGWDESCVMTFHLTHVDRYEREASASKVITADVSWLRVAGEFVDGAWQIDVMRFRPGGAHVFLAEVARDASRVEKALVLFDVDWMMAYDDAYGYAQGDLALARAQTVIERATLAERGRCARIGGEEIAVVMDASRDGAAAFAEKVRIEIEKMNLPFEHREVKTHGRLTVSAGVVCAGPDPVDTGKRLEAALLEAKRAGGNRVVVRVGAPPADR